jgi:hypothetical protein
MDLNRVWRGRSLFIFSMLMVSTWELAILLCRRKIPPSAQRRRRLGVRVMTDFRVIRAPGPNEVAIRHNCEEAEALPWSAAALSHRATMFARRETAHLEANRRLEEASAAIHNARAVDRSRIEGG